MPKDSDVPTATIEVGEVHIVRMHCNGKEWEPETRAVWSAKSTLRKGEVMLDIGAYNGIYGIAAAMMGCKVWAFEPHPANYERALLNAALNPACDIPAINIWHTAVSDRAGVRPFQIKSPIHMSDTASLGGIGDDGLLVQTIRIDDLKFDAKVCAIKIDVERHELAVLMGAKNTIITHKPNIVVECLTETAKAEVESFMAMVNYGCMRVLDKRNCLYVPRQL